MEGIDCFTVVSPSKGCLRYRGRTNAALRIEALDGERERSWPIHWRAQDWIVWKAQLQAPKRTNDKILVRVTREYKVHSNFHTHRCATLPQPPGLHRLVWQKPKQASRTCDRLCISTLIFVGNSGKFCTKVFYPAKKVKIWSIYKFVLVSVQYVDSIAELAMTLSAHPPVRAT